VSYIAYQEHDADGAQGLKDRVILAHINGRVEHEAVVLLVLPQVVAVLRDELLHRHQLFQVTRE
jgi:hypothetical protein